jgi:Holliday junction resolvase
LSRYNRKKDAIQNDMVDALEKAGCTVTDMSTAGGGFPDLFVTRAGVHYALEVKAKRGTLTEPQKLFRVKHAPVHIVRTIDQAFRAVGLIR